MLSIGLRDLGILRTLVAIAFRWAIDTRLNRILKYWSHLSSDSGGTSSSGVSEVEDSEDMKNVYNQLLDKIRTLLLLLEGEESVPTLQHRPMAFLIIPQHVTGLLRGGIAFGWGPDEPKSLDMRLAVHSVLDM